MTLKKNLGLFLVTLFVGFTAYLQWSNQKEVQVKKDTSQKVLHISDPKDVHTIALQNNNFFVELYRKKGIWHIEKPIESLADQGFVGELLKKIMEETKKSEVQAPNEVGNFSENSVRLTIEQKDQPPQTLLVSSKEKAHDGSPILFLPSTGSKIVGSNYWSMFFDFNLFFFRNKFIYNSLGQANSIEFHKTDGTIFIFDSNKSGMEWRLRSDSSRVIEPRLMSAFFREVTGIKAARYVSEVWSEVVEKEFGLAKPLLRLKIGYLREGFNPWELIVGVDVNGKHYGRIQGENQVFQLQRKVVDKLKMHFNSI